MYLYVKLDKGRPPATHNATYGMISSSEQTDGTPNNEASGRSQQGVTNEAFEATNPTDITLTVGDKSQQHQKDFDNPTYGTSFTALK